MPRGLLVSTLLFLVVVTTAAGAARPEAMVLRQTDVPRGFLQEFRETGTFPLPETIRGAPYGFLTRFHTVFRDVSPPYWRTISSSIFVFRRADGARRFLERQRREADGAPSARVRRASIGSGGWVSTTPAPTPATAVVGWRQGRFLGLVVCERLRRCEATALRLARTQQRRMVAAIR